MNYKKYIAAVMALSMATGVAGCGSSSNSSSKAEDDFSATENVAVADTESIEAIPEGAEKEILYLGEGDLNPTKGSPEKSTELQLFESKGGKIRFQQTSNEDRFDNLAAAITANKDIPDIFKYEWLAFPSQVVKDMYQPIDSIVDFSQPLWSATKDTADQFMLNGKHYVAPLGYSASAMLCYDKDIIDAEGLDDPYELYQDGKWDWNAWYDMMSEYVEGAAADEERYGINGWFAPFIFQSTGKTLITYDADKDEYVSNLNDADFVRASDMLYDIAKNGMYYPDWVGQAGDAFKKNILFYAMGPWASTGTHSPKDGDNWGVVPMPKDPNSDTLYTTIDMNAYMWVKGSTKNDAMKCWLECAKIVYTQDTYKDIEKEKFFVNNPNWTEDMYNVAYVDLVTDKFTKIFDPGYGISTTLSDNDAATNDTKEAVIPYLYTSVMKTDENGSQYTWTQLKEQYKGTVDSELKTLNDQYHAYLEKNK